VGNIRAARATRSPSARGARALPLRSGRVHRFTGRIGRRRTLGPLTKGLPYLACVATFSGGANHTLFTQLAFVHYPVAIIVDEVTNLGAGAPRGAISFIAGKALTNAPTDTAERTNPVIHPAVAIFIRENVANLHAFWMCVRIVRITISPFRGVPRRRHASHHRVATREFIGRVEPIPIFIREELDGNCTLVYFTITVVVALIAEFDGPRVSFG